MLRRKVLIFLSLTVLLASQATRTLLARQPAAASPQQPAMAIAPFDSDQAKVYQAAWAEYLDVPVEQTNSLSVNLLLIPPGEFLMGSSDAQVEAALKVAAELAIDDNTQRRIRVVERPQHRVQITAPFWLAATEVTIDQFRKFVEATDYRTEAELLGSANSASDQKAADGSGDKFDWRFPGFKQQAEAAVSQVTWNDAVAFCNWLSEKEGLRPAYSKHDNRGWVPIADATGYRLPTESEWEFAARAGTTTQFHCGDDPATLKDYAWFGFRSGSNPERVVGAKLPNPFGLYDMHGNIGEWCQDYYLPTSYPKHFEADRPPAEGETRRVIRGGDWWGNALRCRSAFRGYGDQVTRSDDLGFRLARSQ